MTREQAIAYGKRVIDLDLNDETQAFCELAIKALEREPCEDCVSRAEVREFVNFVQLIKDNHNEQGKPINYGTICDIVIRAHKLLDSPPVQPKRMVGKWVMAGNKPIRENMIWDWRCSNCNNDPQKFNLGIDDWRTVEAELPRFCPSCGAEMERGEDEKPSNAMEIIQKGWEEGSPFDMALKYALKNAVTIPDEQLLKNCPLLSNEEVLEQQSDNISDDGTLTVNVKDGRNVTRVLVCGENHFGGMYYLDEEKEPCEDCVSRAEVVDELNRLGRNAFKDDTDYDNFFAFLDSLQSVTPTNCIATIHFSKDELQKIVDEKVQELVAHGTCKDCSIKRLDKEESEEVGAEKYFCPVVCGYVDETPDFYCEKFEKGGSEDVRN